ncbi:type 1 fimbrial protein [Salmonella enterica subsp. enterica serovar Weston]|nr:type 1 fimbrial protein [Salmonella enterica subsp. enterica serovar Weston]
MSMKKYLAMITGSLLVSSSAMAVSDNTITFQGEVSDETCSVVINGNQAKPVVLLPTVSTKDLSEQGKTAGPITFDIGLSGCTGSKDKTTKISTVFVGNQVTSNGNLGNTGDGDLQLEPNASEASATYTARYYSTGKAEAGTVAATLQYAVSYK